MDASQPTRARPSATQLAVLSLVIERPSYGYEVCTRFASRARSKLSNAGVYKALERLEDAGLIEVYRLGGSRRQPKPHYRATELGERMHQRWLLEILRYETRDLRQRLLSAPMDTDALRELIDRYETACLSDADAPPLRPGASLRARITAEWERRLLDAERGFIDASRQMLAHADDLEAR